MGDGFMGYSQRHRESLLGAVIAGAFFVLVGVLFVITPDLFNRIVDFLSKFTVVPVPNTGNFNISLPAPINPSAHTVLYRLAQEFSYAWGVFLIAVLALRYVLRSEIRRKAENLGDIVFWLVAGYLIGAMLNQLNQTMNVARAQTIWFAFWAEILILIGVTLLVRAFFLAAHTLWIRQGTQTTQTKQL